MTTIYRSVWRSIWVIAYRDLLNFVSDSFQLVASLAFPLLFPLIFLAGVFFPVARVPLWMAVLSKLNPVTHGVDAVRQVILSAAPAATPAKAPAKVGLGITVFGHTLTLVQDMAVVSVLGILLIVSAVWAFGRQE